jgi:hypothetical protein
MWKNQMYLFCKACVVAFVAMTRLQAMDPSPHENVAPAPLPPREMLVVEPESEQIQAMDPSPHENVASAPLPPREMLVAEPEPEPEQKPGFQSLYIDSCKDVPHMPPADTETFSDLKQKFGNTDSGRRAKFKRQIVDDWQNSDIEYLLTLFNKLRGELLEKKATLATIEMLKTLIATLYRYKPQTKKELKSCNDAIICGLDLLTNAQNLQAWGENKNHAWEAFFRGTSCSPDKELSERLIYYLYIYRAFI